MMPGLQPNSSSLLTTARRSRIDLGRWSLMWFTCATCILDLAASASANLHCMCGMRVSTRERRERERERERESNTKMCEDGQGPGPNIIASVQRRGVQRNILPDSLGLLANLRL